jgi:hypothetical protein
LDAAPAQWRKAATVAATGAVVVGLFARADAAFSFPGGSSRDEAFEFDLDESQAQAAGVATGGRLTVDGIAYRVTGIERPESDVVTAKLKREAGS